MFRKTLSSFLFALSLASLALLAFAAPAAPLKGEGPEHALLRARAFQEMYAGADGTLDPEWKLRAARFLQREAVERRRGSLAIQGSSWVSIGPSNGAGRVSALAVHPTNPNIVYRGTAGGGVWKTTDAGATWSVLTDDLGNLSIGAVALAPSNPNIVYAGTGEGILAIDAIGGIGFIKSTDGGATWQLPSSVVATSFFDLSVHPTNPNEILAATNVGVLLSTDGGSTWTPGGTVIATALSRDPGNPGNVVLTNWNRSTFAGGVYFTSDGGRNWNKVGGAGTAPWDSNTGRIFLTRSKSNPQLLFTLAASANGNTHPECTKAGALAVDQTGLYVSTDGGQHWSFKSNPVQGSCGTYASVLGQQGWYAGVLAVDPANTNTLYASGFDTWKSTDGGGTFTQVSIWYRQPPDPQHVHADAHASAWVGNAFWIGNDGGVDRSTDGGATWVTLNSGIVTRQYYFIALSSANRDLVIAGAQDNGTSLRTTKTTQYDEVIGGDGFGVAVTPDGNTVYGTVYNNQIERQVGGGGFKDVSPPVASTERTPFITPLTMDPSNPNVLYTASNFLWKTTNGGTSWSKPSSTDLGDGAGQASFVAVAPSNSNVIATGMTNGVVKLSTNGGSTFSSALHGGLPTSVWVSYISFDPKNANTFYVAYTTTSSIPRLYKTTNQGGSFSSISGGLPDFPIHVVKVDPTDSNVLFAGTDVGLFRSTDAGGSWNRFGTGLPAVSIYDIGILADGSLVRVATHGRGIFELTTAASGNRPPTASITSPSSDVTIAPGQSVSCAAAASDPDGDPLTYLWNYGDGLTSTALSPGAHVYATAGTYTITFVATDSKQASSSPVSRTVTVRVPTPTSCTAHDLIRDNGFEDGLSPSTVAGNSGVSGAWKWSSTGGLNPITLDADSAFTGQWFAFLGGWGKNAGDKVSQEISIPAGANARLSYLRQLFTEETGFQPYDVFTVEIRDTSDRILTTLRSYSNLDADEYWYIASFDISQYAGQTVRVVFTSTEDDSLATALYIDDVYVAVTCGSPGRALSVVNAGSGSGTVTSSPGGISCAGPRSCASVFPDNSTVTLSAVAGQGSTFGGWQGGCSGTGACSVSMTSSRGVTAVFNGSAPQSLALSSGRVAVTIDWQSQYDGSGGKAYMIPQKDEFGFAYFTDPNNPEVFFKVLDFGGGKALCFVGGLSDFYYRVTFTAVSTGQTLVFEKPAGQFAGFANNGGLRFGATRPTLLRRGGGGDSSPKTWTTASGLLNLGVPDAAERPAPRVAPAPAAREAALADPQNLTLSQGRVQVTVEWRSQYSGQTGTAFAIPKQDGFGFFYFTDPNNPEVFVKVLDFGQGGALCFVGGLSDFYYKVTFKTLRTGQTLVFEKQPGDLVGFADNGTLRF